MPRDVLEVLEKLPPSCLVWDGEKALIIHRGVMGRVEYPAAVTLNDVVIWNREHGVTGPQIIAMESGCHLGWDCEGADLPTSGPNTYIYSAPVQILLSVNAHCEEDAAKQAEKSLAKLVQYMGDTSSDNFLTVARDGNIDLVEEHRGDDSIRTGDA